MLPSSFIAAAYFYVRLTPQDFGRLASHLDVFEQPANMDFFSILLVVQIFDDKIPVGLGEAG